MRLPAVLLLASTLAAVDAPSGLLCDLIPDDAAPIVTTAPAFSWIVGPAEADSVQGAYQVQVASAADLLTAGTPDLWDSGWVSSQASVAVRYAGPPLTAGHAGVWRVRVRDVGGRSSPFSAPARFTVASSPGLWPRRPLVTTRSAGVVQAAGGSDEWRVDFPRHAFGWLELGFAPDDVARLPGPTPITVQLGERLDKTGAVDRKPGGSIRYASTTLLLTPGVATYRVVLPPDARNTGKDAVKLPKELGVVLPFRHVAISGCRFKPQAVQVAVHYPFDEQAAAFRAGEPTLDAVWELCRYSIKATSFCGIYVDGDRERIAYEGDAYLNQLSHYTTDREYALARTSYEYLLDHPTWPTEWAQHMVLIAWSDWMYTGDLAAAERSWSRLVGSKALLKRMRGDGLLDTKGLRDLVDWPTGERDGYDFKAVNTVVNAFHCRVLQCLGDLAQALGRTEEATQYRADAARAIASLNRVLFDPARGVYVDGEGSTHASQHANMVPLAFDLVPAERRASVAAFVEGRRMACSVYGAQYLLEGLFLAGRAEAAIALMSDRGARGWWNMLAQGSTVTLEAWNAAAKPNLDWNHAWGAAPANILPRHVLGVRPAAPGCATMLVHPQPGRLAHVEGTVPTIRGPLVVSVDNPADGRFTVTVVVPGNTEALVDVGSRVERVGPGRHVVAR